MSDEQAKNTALPALRNQKGLREREPPATPGEVQARHRDYLAAATADNTRRAYRSAIRHFERWGGRLPTDRDSLIRYLGPAGAFERNVAFRRSPGCLHRKQPCNRGQLYDNGGLWSATSRRTPW